MRSRSAPVFLTAAMAAASLSGLASPSGYPLPPLTGSALTGPMDPTVDDDLLQVDDQKPEPATSDRARVAPGPSERKEAAMPEVRQTPAGGQAAGKPDGSKPAGAEEGKRDD
jgi:hypothetical protein